MKTVLYFFRGTCSQLTALNTHVGSLRAGGVDVVAVTAEPGGAAALRERLEARGVPRLDYEVRSDPEHKSLEVPVGDVFVTKKHEWDVSGPYVMIQPAVVVLDDDGVPIKECTWSWKTMGFGNLGELDKVETQPWNGPVREVALVTFRPVISDLLSAINERRPVKLSSTHEQVQDILKDDSEFLVVKKEIMY
ncbi:hypothetical protein CTAYLR_010437 [Chrysophaeum taylorii]|uniref:Uncharacterized protein n=1 Tax=Chrysophaeum taylorii TaxID=2483200 RepID=A0AAD7U7Y2_9STRA|nr:hypothetical protein CTAYLR_010437 [Chrysophaeum taylorii]